MAQSDKSQTQNYGNYNTNYPVALFAQQAWNSPMFALGNFLGQYLGQRYLGNRVDGQNQSADTQDVQQPQTNNGDFQHTLIDAAVPRFSLDENGNAQYHSPSFTPGVEYAPIQAPETFKDYVQGTNGQQGLLNFGQLAQAAGITPANYSHTLTDAAVPRVSLDANGNAQYQAPTVGMSVPTFNPGTGNDLANYTAGANATVPIQPTGNSDIAAIDGTLGQPINGQLSMNLNGSSPFTKWQYIGQYSPKNYGDIAQLATVSPEEATASDEQPIQAQAPAIQAAEQPIKEEQPPITEDKKEVLDGKKLRVLSANDGNMYTFTLSDDGKWLTLDGSNARYAANDKDRIIAALHNPQNSPIDIEEMGTSTHNNVIEPSKEDAALIAKDPKLQAKWRERVNNQDARNMNDASNPGIYPDVHIGMPTTTGQAQPASQDTKTANAGPQPFNEADWERQFVIDNMKRGLSFGAIGDMVNILRPTMQAKEDAYNSAQAETLWPAYWTAVQMENQPALIRDPSTNKMVANPNYAPPGTSFTILNQLAKFDPERANLLLSNSPMPINYFQNSTYDQRFAQKDAADMRNALQKRQWDLDDTKEKYAHDENMENLRFVNNATLKKIEATLSTDEKLRYDTLSAQGKYDFLISHGASPTDAAYGAYGISRPKIGGSSSSGGSNKSGGSDSNGMTFSQAKDIISDYEKWKKDNPDSPDYDYPFASVLPRAQSVINGFAIPDLPDDQRNNYDAVMPWVTSLIEANAAQGNKYSFDQIVQAIRDNVDPGIVDKVLEDSQNYMQQNGLWEVNI